MAPSNARTCFLGVIAIAAAALVGDVARRRIEAETDALDARERRACEIDRARLAHTQREIASLRSAEARAAQALRDEERALDTLRLQPAIPGCR
jgi:hypothetical protein